MRGLMSTLLSQRAWRSKPNLERKTKFEVITFPTVAAKKSPPFGADRISNRFHSRHWSRRLPNFPINRDERSPSETVSFAYKKRAPSYIR